MLDSKAFLPLHLPWGKFQLGPLPQVLTMQAILEIQSTPNQCLRVPSCRWLAEAAYLEAGSFFFDAMIPSPALFQALIPPSKSQTSMLAPSHTSF